MKTRRGFGTIIDSAFEQSLVNDSSANTSLRKPMRTDLLLCDRWQTPAQACTCYKKSDI